MHQEFLSSDDYRSIIKNLVSKRKKQGSPISIRKISADARVQYTYLSKALNNPSVQLAEDHLYSIGHSLGLDSQEIDYLILLRSRETTGLAKRRQYLEDKIQQIRSRYTLTAEVRQQLDLRDMELLYSPNMFLCHMALHVEHYRQDPLQLAQKLSIAPEELIEILNRLQQLKFIELNQNPLRVISHKELNLHFSKNDRRMRTHQTVMRARCQNYLSNCPERAKESFMVTFTADKKALQEISSKFKVFSQEVQRTVQDSKNEELMQINFDLFIW